MSAMVCSTCGSEQFAGARFCGRCGAKIDGGFGAPANAQAWTAGAAMPAGAMPMPGMPYPAVAAPPAARVRNHLQPLGILWIVFGAYRILAAVVAAVAFHALERNGMFGDVPPFLHDLAGGLLPAVALLVGAFSLLTIATGWALLTRRAWGPHAGHRDGRAGAAEAAARHRAGDLYPVGAGAARVGSRVGWAGRAG